MARSRRCGSQSAAPLGQFLHNIANRTVKDALVCAACFRKAALSTKRFAPSSFASLAASNGRCVLQPVRRGSASPSESPIFP